MRNWIEHLRNIQPLWWTLIVLVVLQLVTLGVSVWTLHRAPSTTVDVRVSCWATSVH